MLGTSVGVTHADPGLFSVAGLKGWETQLFKNKTPTDYRLTHDNGVQVLEAECRAGASGLIWKEPVDLTRTPVLSWRWYVPEVFRAINEREKKGDDFVARVYVVRDGGWALWRTRSLVYVWASGQPAGSHWPSAYAEQAHVVALRGGVADTGRWWTETRNVREDFRRFFGSDAQQLDAVALMTDCDDSGATARARYGDLVWRAGGP
ncbi:MAG: DUF3047 domain-containing protein [Nevskiales bacterium]|nr:DUF3047 domain-containing protein [Nevskiales bacterium]